MKRALAVGAVAVIAGLWASSAGAAAPPPPKPVTLMGVYLDAAVNGTTRGYIDCGGTNTMAAPEGDATLFIANVVPGRYRCTITITATP